MPGLRDLQTSFARAIYDGELEPRLLKSIDAGGLAAEERVGIYGSSARGILADALAAVYPVVQRLVGEEFFGAMARRYLRSHPSSSGDLHEFGGGLAEFLADFEPVAELVYLPDTARLEWAYHRVFHGADASPLHLEELAAVRPEDYEGLRFRVNPAAALLASDYPVHRIWAANQPDTTWEEPIDLAEGGAHLLVRRDEVFVVEVLGLDVAQFTLLSALAEGQTLVTATEAALEQDPRFDLSSALGERVKDGTLVDILRAPGEGTEQVVQPAG